MARLYAVALLLYRRDADAPPWRLARLFAVALPLTSFGCAVPQPRGEGKLERIVEPATKRPYCLYLPKDYVEADEAGRAARRWPLVVTFHGMKPYDVALYQAREWEQEADRYGYIVVAPELNAFVFLFGQFPIRTINRAFKSDELATLAILDHVFETTRADPSNVLSTSWSSGGYIAHYMLNRHPERFTCLAVRQSNFSSSVLDSTGTSRSLYHPVLILTAERDIGICMKESRAAIKWYESHGYKNLAWVHIKQLGHERTPDMAADFFARVCAAQPNRSPKVLVGRQAIDGNPTGLALLAGNLGHMQAPQCSEPSLGLEQVALTQPPTQPRPVLLAAPRGLGAAAPAVRKPTPKRAAASSKAGQPLGPLAIRVSSAIGFEPLLLVYSAECPSDWHRTAQFYWTLNGKHIADGVNGQRTISEPGDYTLEVRVLTAAGVEHRAARQIRVLRNVEAQATP